MTPSPSNTAWAREEAERVSALLTDALTQNEEVKIIEAALLAAERKAKEECAQICDANDNGNHMLGVDGRLMARRIGAAIRSTLPPTSKAGARG